MDREQPEIREGDIAMAVDLSRRIPEFIAPHGPGEYQRRLAGVPHLILIAWLDGQPAGFKVGYEREGQFYSWMGGILPSFRRRGIAAALARRQENWAKLRGYTTITFKTRNHHKGMLIFALQNGFDIIGIEVREQVHSNRILLQKTLI